MKSYSISNFAKRCGLSRSTLLYYSKIGLLHAAGRSSANYRIYGQEELERLQTIRKLRETGLALKDIINILESEPEKTPAILSRRLQQIRDEIRQLQNQQEITLTLLRHPEIGTPDSAQMTKEKWTAMLVAAGLDEDGMHRWHSEFEKSSGEAHRLFLQSLGIGEEEITRIRAWSRLREAPRR